MPRSKPAPNLKALTAKWYAKLAKTGFVEIEDVNSEREMLKRWDGHWFRTRGTVEQFQAKERYFQLAATLLNDSSAWTSTERKIWEMHCQGKSLRETGRKLKMNHEVVGRVVRKLRKQIVWK